MYLVFSPLFLNTVSKVELIDMVSPENVVRLAKSSGIESEVQANPSIALGSSNLQLIEMAQAYTSYVNKSIPSSPIFITKIEDKEIWGTFNLTLFRDTTRAIQHPIIDYCE